MFIDFKEHFLLSGNYCEVNHTYPMFQMFTPTEKLENPLVINLIFYQLVQDVFAHVCLRIAGDQRSRMRSKMGESNINSDGASANMIQLFNLAFGIVGDVV